MIEDRFFYDFSCRLLGGSTCISGGSPRLPAAQLQNSQSGSSLACSCRVCVNMAALLGFPAVFCGAKFAMQRYFRCFPPFASATISPTPPTLMQPVILWL
jgi:hypothetical protein